MSNIINEDSIGNHDIEKFQFQSLDLESVSGSSEPISFEDIVNQENLAPTPKKSTETPEVASEFLSKIEELSDENVKLQLSLESLEKELDQRIKDESDKAYEDGKSDGIKEATSTMQEDQDELKTQLVKSITNLDEKIHSLDLYLQEIKDQLIDSAAYIAKKVIKKELDLNSSVIAKNIASSFLEDLKDATDIKLKVNPQDATYLSQHFSSEKNIKIEPDDAINKGGIIILSDIGNIDGDIKTRIKKAISLIKQEG